MYAQVSAVAAPTKTDMPEINRRSVNFHPSIWGDRFLTYASEFLVSCPFESACTQPACFHACANVQLRIFLLFQLRNLKTNSIKP